MKHAFLPASLAGLIGVLVLIVGSQGAGAAKDSVVGSASKVVLFSSDGMRPDLMRQYVGQGRMPTYAQLLRDGVQGDNGMTQGFPPNTGVGWYTMATGTWPAEHGSTNNTFHRTGDTFSNRTSFSGPGVLQADTIANAGERAGKKVAQIEWVGGRAAGIKGPTVDFMNFFSTRGVLAFPFNSVEKSGADTFNIFYGTAGFAPALGWTNVPAGDPVAPAQQTSLPVNSTSSSNPNRAYDVYIYDSVVDGTARYDRVILLPSAPNSAGKNGSDPRRVDLSLGDFKEIKLKGADGLIGSRAGQTAGFYVKLIRLETSGGAISGFKLYFTSVERAIASCATPACAAAPINGDFESFVANTFPTAIAADFAPLEAGIIDEETYVQQGRDLEAAYGDAVLEFILGTLQPDTDLALVGYPVTDEFSHQFMALVSPTDIDGDPNPCFDVTPKFDDVTCTGRGTAGRVAIREGFIRSAYEGADAKLAIARRLMGGNPTTMAASDHGFAPQWLAVNANKVLNAAAVNGVSLHASNANASNCGATTTDITKACWAGGTIQVYVNPARLKSSTNPTFPTYEEVRTAVRNAFQSLSDPANPGKQVISRILNKEDLRNVDGTDALYPNRSGDVVVVTQPPYQSDAGTNDVAIALSHFFGQHGYLPNLVNLANNVNMHATFVAAGPGIVHSTTLVPNVRAIDLAPTLAFLQGYPGPQNASGKILYGITQGGSSLKEVAILDISDYHGQLTPLSERSDPSLGSASPSFAIGGAAFLKPWFDVYRGQNPGGTLTVTAGDAVGATPPISNFFGDKPTIELMNKMGFDLDGLGNHNFDRGQTYLREQLIPLAKFKYVSANVVDPKTGEPPAEWSKSRLFDFGPFKIGVIGFTNDDAPTLVKPGSFDPFVVTNSLAAVNKRAEQLGKQQQVAAVIAIGHLGATSGTITNPAGPLIDLADNVQGVDAVIGDHTNFQVISQRENRVLVTENLSKGVRFTRVRLVIDTATGELVYKTADFHKPWTIGVTADPEIQARLDVLRAQIAPQLSEVIGNSTVEVPRADACGNSDGRICESKVGNVVADAVRAAYGTDFALMNSGGLRADLTCPATDKTDDFCPAFTPPPFPITKGQVFEVLPFGNFGGTVGITGAELKTMLENGVAAALAGSPAGSEPGLAPRGAFPQISGLCFTYDIARAVNARVVSAVKQVDGSCTGAAVLFDSTPYTIALNDFTASGGDSYPNFGGRFHSDGRTLDTIVSDYIAGKGTISPAIQGRITCTSSGSAVCSTVTP